VKKERHDCQGRNIVLIGMPGAGKSTIGVLLAKCTTSDFIDTDVLIQMRKDRPLQDIVDAEGYIRLREIEEEILLSLSCANHVIATGGSAAYSSSAMKHLKSNGVMIFLDVAFEEIAKRVHDFDARGIARRADQTFEDLFNERRPLYLEYADIVIDCGTRTQEEITELVLSALNISRYSSPDSA